MLSQTKLSMCGGDGKEVGACVCKDSWSLISRSPAGVNGQSLMAVKGAAAVYTGGGSGPICKLLPLKWERN